MRETAGLSQRDLGLELSYVASTISGWEKAWRLPSDAVATRYETFFKRRPNSLVRLLHKARAEQSDPTKVRGKSPGDVCPYRGMYAFEREDAALFFGRESQIATVLAELAKARFVAVIGDSGSGKSSFARAGLHAGISAAWTAGGRIVRVATLTPGEHPLDELASAVSAATAGAALVSADDLRADPRTLETAARDAGIDDLVILVDQFEEVFALCGDEDERRGFIDALITGWRDPSSRVVVILTLRADRYGSVVADPQLAAAVVAHQTPIAPLTPVELRRAIARPAEECSLGLEEGLVETILDELAGEPGAMPLLSHALLETWKLRETATLTIRDYRQAGGVRDAIAQTAEATLQRLSDTDRTIARSIFLSLTDLAATSEPTRRRVDRAELAPHQDVEAVERVLGVLARARLVTIGERTVVVAHEALIRHWPRLRGWIDADRAGLLVHRRLSEDARQWEALHREPAALYRGARLATASEWATDHAGDLSPLELEFVAAGDASARRELAESKRRARRLLVFTCGLATLSVAVAVLAALAFKQRGAAQRLARDATSHALASSALRLTESRPDVALLFALHGYRASPSTEARRSVLTALMAASDPGVITILHGHSNPVSTVAFSPGGRRLATASLDSTIRIWTARHRFGKPLTGHRGYVLDLAFSRDGNMLASAGADGTIRLWDPHKRTKLGDPLVQRGVFSVAFSPTGRTLASAGADGTIRLWNVRTREPIAAVRDRTAGVLSVAFSPNGKLLASATDDGALRLSAVPGLKPVGAPLRGHAGKVLDVAFRPDGRVLASAGADATVRLWSMRTGRQRGAPLTGHAGAVRSVAFRHDGQRLASAGLDGTVRLWDVPGRRQLGAPLRGHAGEVLGVAFSPKGGRLASAGYDSTVRMWSVRSHLRAGSPLVGHTGRIVEVAFSPSGGRLASAGEDRTIRVWSVRTHKQVGATLEGHKHPVYRLAFSPYAPLLASAGADRTIRLWSLTTHKPIGGPMKHDSYVRSLAFGRGGTLASAGADRKIRLWDVRTRSLVGVLRGHTDSVVSVAFSPDGRTLASAGVDKTIRLWNVHTLLQIGEPVAADVGDVFRVAFYADGRRLAIESLGGTISRDVRTQLGLPPASPAGDDLSLAISGDGRGLVSPGPRNAVRLWDVGTYEQLGSPLTGQPRSARIVVESPDGRTVAAVAAGNTIRLWDALLWRTFRDLEARVCRLAGGGLSKAEWQRHAAGIPYRRGCS